MHNKRSRILDCHPSRSDRSTHKASEGAGGAYDNVQQADNVSCLHRHSSSTSTSSAHMKRLYRQQHTSPDRYTWKHLCESDNQRQSFLYQKQQFPSLKGMSSARVTRVDLKECRLEHNSLFQNNSLSQYKLHHMVHWSYTVWTAPHGKLVVHSMNCTTR